MLKNTFCHIPGIGTQTEQRLWDSGVHSWEDLSKFKDGALPVSKSRTYGLRRYIDQSIRHLNAGDPHYFAELLPSDQSWRLFPDFRGSTAYIDIETTGTGFAGDYITTIALYDGRSIYWYVQGHNLNDFKAQVRKYQVIITFNGKCFDLPFIRSYLGLRMSQAHIDLRYVLRSLGYAGGLKKCEKQLGIDRADLDGLDGMFAVLLWNEYKRNHNPKALETLLAYNIQDVVNLETLMVLSYNSKLQNTPFHDALVLTRPAVPAGPFKPDLATVDKIRARLHTNW